MINWKQTTKNCYLYQTKEFYKNICYIALREIGTVHFIFPELKMIILFSGFHGLMSSEELISDELLNELSNMFLLIW